MDELPLAGFTVAARDARRREELIALLERRGARVVEAPAIRIVSTGDDEELLATTRACIAAAPDVVVATTGIGFRGWLDTAEAAGLAPRARVATRQIQESPRGFEKFLRARRREKSTMS